MRKNPRIGFETRKRLDQEFLDHWKSFFSATWYPESTYRRAKGWIKSIRTALGMSSRQMAKFMGKTNPEILALEKREALGTITLESLDQAARALGCHLIYALVPNRHYSLESLLDEQATQAAKSIVKKTSHSMALENQQVDITREREQISDLAHEMKQKLDPKIWSGE